MAPTVSLFPEGEPKIYGEIRGEVLGRPFRRFEVQVYGARRLGTVGYRFTDREALYARIRQLAQLGVEYYMCEITFARNNIPKDKLRPDEFLKWVPSGVGALGELQAKGYGYIKVG